MDHEMKVVCAWCDKHLRGPEDAPQVSHGICMPCREREEKECRKLAPANFKEWVDLCRDVGGEG